MDTSARISVHDEAVETLRHTVAAAQTRRQFGKRLQAFRETTTGLSVRVFAKPLFMESSTVSDKENGNSAFDELQLRDYMGGCGVTDDDLIAFCWKHCQRTKDLISAPTENSEKSQPMNIQSSSLPGPTDIKPTLSALDTQRRRSIPQGIFLAGLSFVFVTLIVLVVTSIGSNIPAAINSVTNSLIARPYMGGMITIVQDYEHLGCMTAENIDKVASNELAEPDEPTQRVIIKNCGRTSTSEQVTGGWHTKVPYSN